MTAPYGRGSFGRNCVPTSRDRRERWVLRSQVRSNLMHDAHPRRRVQVRRVDECDTLDELIRHCFPAFGGAFLRRIYTILDSAIGMGCPLTLAISGPVTVSGQHQAWLIPLLETGWIAYSEHHRRGVLSRRPPQPRTRIATPCSRFPSGATTARCATRAPFASPTWPSTKKCCSIRTSFSPRF